MELLNRLKRWHQTWPQSLATYTYDASTEHHCPNCGHDYAGNFCPHCGQKSNMQRFTWKSMLTGILDVWDLSGRSVPSTLLQLCYRPGYLLRDYFQGRRQSYFPPIKLLLLVSLLTLSIEYFVSPYNGEKEQPREERINPEDGDYRKEYKTLFYKQLDRFFEWSDENSGWGALLFHSCFILPTFWLFRRSRSYPKITVPECFFMQAYLCSAMLICSCVSGYLRGFILMYLPIFYLAYHQLFGYSRWGTMWRVLLTILIGLCFTIFIVIIIGMLYAVYLDLTGVITIPLDEV
jgi:hypothetical protein